tara:strand:+ start:208 stop:360 length:153 start_codon:yes stop_codon:yes gene_type:complete
MKTEDINNLAEHFFEKCPTEARNFFHQILEKLEKIDKRIDKLESKLNNSS